MTCKTASDKTEPEMIMARRDHLIQVHLVIKYGSVHSGGASITST